jgi:cyclohexanone monooxygenase
MGVSNTNYPNMFMVLGPNGPFTNLPPSIEAQVEWIADLIQDVNAKNLSTVEATPEAEAGWTKTCQEIANMTLFPKADSWIFGANIPGKTNTVYFYMAGLGAYRNQLSEVKSSGYQGFTIQ